MYALKNDMGITLHAENRNGELGELRSLVEVARREGIRFGAAGVFESPWLRETLPETGDGDQSQLEANRQENRRRAGALAELEGMNPYVWFVYLDEVDFWALIDETRLRRVDIRLETVVPGD